MGSRGLGDSQVTTDKNFQKLQAHFASGRSAGDGDAPHRSGRRGPMKKDEESGPVNGRTGARSGLHRG